MIGGVTIEVDDKENVSVIPKSLVGKVKMHYDARIRLELLFALTPYMMITI